MYRTTSIMKKKKIDDFFDRYHIPLLNDIHHPALTEEQKQNNDPTDYEKKTKMYHQRRKIDCRDSLEY